MDKPTAHKTTYEIRRLGDLICQAPTGILTLDEVWRLNAAFFNVTEAQGTTFTRALMDYRGVTEVALSVPEFTKAGLSEQQRLGPPTSRFTAAYVASDPVVFGFARVIQGVWTAYADVEVFPTLPEALRWLNLTEAEFAEAELIDKG